MASQTPTLESLASTISRTASTITASLTKHNLSHPSFEPNNLRNYDVPDGELQAARMALIEAAESILHLARGPSDYLSTTMLQGKFDTFVIAALSEWGVYDAVPLEGEITYTDLSAKVNVPENKLRRVLHHAINNHIFFSPSENSIAHTATSVEVVLNPFIYAFIEVEPAVFKIPEAIARFGDSEVPEQAGAALAFPFQGGNFFGWMERDGVGEPSEEILAGKIVKGDRTRGYRSRRFGGAMQSLMSTGVHAAKHVNFGFDWASLGRATVVDVGGSKGHVSLELARQYPDLTIVVQDYESLRGGFNTIFPSELKSRVSFQAHDFFTPQTTPADVYLLKSVLHDWPENEAITILRNLVVAMKPGNRIVIMDMIMTGVGEGPQPVNKMMTSVDLQMMAALNAKERTKRDWEDLVKTTDDRLKVRAFRQPPGAAAHMIEVVFDG